MKIASKPATALSSHEETLVYALQSLSDKTRFKIFKLLVADQNMCVSQIAQELDISVPAVSQHFRIFELVGLVGKQRQGQKVCYKLKADDPLVKQLVNFVTS